MKVCGLVAIREFYTNDASGPIKAKKFEVLEPLYFSTAKRLIKAGLAVRRRTWKITGEKQDG